MTNDCNKVIYSVETGLDILVGKWKPIILAQIIKQGTLRFSELQRLVPGITKKMLTTQLRELEKQHIIHREVYPQVPPKVEYSLTKYGYTLIPVLEAIYNWGMKHIEFLEQQEVSKK